MTHRFYRSDGTVEHHEVDRRSMQRFDDYVRHEDAGLPAVWLVAYIPELRLEALGVDTGAMLRGIKRAFERRDYGYHPDFIGPHRNSDYHEAP